MLVIQAVEGCVLGAFLNIPVHSSSRGPQAGLIVNPILAIETMSSRRQMTLLLMTWR